MPEGNAQGAKSEGFGSAANLMIEALERASQELERTVKHSLEQLQHYSEGVDRNFALQLERVTQQSNYLVDLCGNELEAKRDETLDAISALETQELDRLTARAAEVRSQCAQTLEAARINLEKIMQSQIVELVEAVTSPGNELYEMSRNKVEHLETYAESAKADIDSSANNFEDTMSFRAREIEDQAQSLIESKKGEVESTLALCSSQFDQKIASVETDLSQIVDKACLDLKELIDRGVANLSDSHATNQQVISEHLDHFKDKLLAVKDKFGKETREQDLNYLRSCSDSIERKLSSSQEEINRIAESARKRMTVNQKMLNNSLRRLEKSLSEEVDKLLMRFEGALSQEARINLIALAGRSGSNNNDAIEKLNQRLRNHGSEVVKTFKRQVEQTEQDFARSSQGNSERIESIRQSAVDALEKQVRVMRTDLERITRNFHNELAELNLKVPIIEESGRAAALSVMAYRSAMLSLEND
jgi:hypothetical protein